MRGCAADPTALLRVAQMQEADRLTVQAGTPAVELMQNAGTAVAREILHRWSPRPVTVLCGPGNNGGDGFVTASVLSAAGWPVRLALAGSVQALRGEAQHHAARWRLGVEPLHARVLEDAALVIDALFGSGLRRPLGPHIAALLGLVAERGLPVVAIDVPSGLLGDTGESLGAIRADLTVTFTRKKPGHVLLPGRSLCGETRVADIGTPAAVLAGIAVDTWENDPALWREHLPQLDATGNKYSRGHALLYGGYPTTGAARMAARAAARAGAGLTSIAVPDPALPIYAAALTSIMVRPLATPGALAGLLEDARFNALLIGPGAGVNDTTRSHALAMLATRRPVLLDADAISVFAKEPQVLFDAIRGPCVLTPHEGEFARLFDPAGDKLARARRAARTSGAVIVLKGADTVVAAPDGRAVLNSNAPPTLATAGSGDVLGGLILGLLAQRMEAFLACAAAVWLHGAAAGDFGPGLLAEDLPDLLPGVLRRLAGSPA
ncbi:MAG TPA: NAD(P)H-hydrate dehydratase [Steroidobacteraceae bacterium]|nr:NAD(P)H-hydrate dehydratase [Steroidobacteraceae bacterium]